MPDLLGDQKQQYAAMYTDEFLELWGIYKQIEAMGLGNAGSKVRAFREWQKLKGDPGHWLRIIKHELGKQVKVRYKAKVEARFFENFQHLERYIKNRRWEDTADEPCTTVIPEIDETEQRKRELMSRDWATKAGR